MQITNTKSEALYQKAYALAVAGDLATSEYILDVAHEMRDLELFLSALAAKATPDLSELLVRASLNGFADDVEEAVCIEKSSALLNAAQAQPSSQRAPIKLSNEMIKLALNACAVSYMKAPQFTAAITAAHTFGFDLVEGQGGKPIFRDCPSCDYDQSVLMHVEGNHMHWCCANCQELTEAGRAKSEEPDRAPSHISVAA